MRHLKAGLGYKSPMSMDGAKPRWPQRKARTSIRKEAVLALKAAARKNQPRAEEALRTLGLLVVQSWKQPPRLAQR